MIAYPLLLTAAAALCVGLVCGFVLGWAGCLHQSDRARPLRDACGHERYRTTRGEHGDQRSRVYRGDDQSADLVWRAALESARREGQVRR